MSESPFTSQGLVCELAEYILQRSDTNPSFAETLSSALVATAIGPNVIVSDEKGDVYLNIFGIVIGGSSISNKTVASNVARRIVRYLGIKLELDLLQPPKFSIEGLSKHLLTNPNGIIIGDEYTSQFQSKSKTWLIDSMEFLSTLYDGYVPKYATIGRGIEYVPQVCVSFTSVTTPYLAKLMKTDDFFLQGTGCRFLWDVDTERDYIDEDPIKAAEFFYDLYQRQETDRKLFAFVDKLAALHTKIDELADGAYNQVLSMMVDMEAAKKLGMYRVQNINKATKLYMEDLLNPDYGYIGRLAENAIKLAAIHCVGRYDVGESRIPEMNGVDVDWAINKTEHHYQMYLKLKDLRGMFASERSAGSHKTDFQRVLDLIDKYGGCVNITKIMQGTHWLREDTLKILQAMVLNKMIEPKTVKPYRSKKHTVYIRHGTAIPWVVKNVVR